eukprot:TRINITY_DN66313_c5_g2_i1.p1 TRINITY_DN66313_c5_g2~~TRINITY_DN66313_c5_g2_i1.p1  ORF type:complete len:500 (+),score=283.70 TRINITY_DN66313_c5_g2_i1:66-1565(+)
MSGVEQVQVQFVRKRVAGEDEASLPEDERRLAEIVAQQPLAVPVKLMRAGLSEILNHLAGRRRDDDAMSDGDSDDDDDDEEERKSGKPKEYDFLVDGRFLRKSLRQYLESSGTSAERTIVLEYVEAMPEPEERESNQHPDWVAAVATLTPSASPSSAFVFSGCYDGTVRLFAGDALEQPLATGDQHRSAVKAVCAARAMRTSDDELRSSFAYFISGGKDRVVNVWRASNVGGDGDDEVESKKNKKKTKGKKKQQESPALDVVGVGKTHSDSIECVAARSHKFVSGSWDKRLIVWKYDVAAEDEAASSLNPNAKRRKGNDRTKTAPSAPLQTLEPLSILQGHTGAVTGVTWPHSSAIYSGGYDHTIRLWDVSSGTNTSTWQGNNVVSSLDFSKHSNLLASSHNDRAVRVWDPRVGQQEIIKTTLKGHKSWVTSVAWSPLRANMLASTSHDGTVKVWDIRSSTPLFTLRKHTDKVLSVAWSGSTLFSGGADKTLHSFQVSF